MNRRMEPAFAAGTRLSHARFGEGQVIADNGETVVVRHA